MKVYKYFFPFKINNLVRILKDKKEIASRQGVNSIFSATLCTLSNFLSLVRLWGYVYFHDTELIEGK